VILKRYKETFIWALRAEKRIALNTKKAYEQDLDVFLNFLEKSELDLQAFYMFLKERDEKDTTIARRFSTAIQFLDFLKEEGELKDFLIDKPKIKIQQTYSTYMESHDLEALRNCLTDSDKDLRLRAIIEILYSTGLRISELLALKIDQLPKILELKYLILQGKGGHERVVFFSSKSIECLQKYISIRVVFSSNDYVFGSRNGSLTRQRVFQLLKELAIKAGIDAYKIFPHSFRHRMLTDLLKGGADLISVQKIAGHKRINTTQRYTHAEDTLFEEVNKFHSLFKKND